MITPVHYPKLESLQKVRLLNQERIAARHRFGRGLHPRNKSHWIILFVEAPCRFPMIRRTSTTQKKKSLKHPWLWSIITILLQLLILQIFISEVDWEKRHHWTQTLGPVMKVIRAFRPAPNSTNSPSTTAALHLLRILLDSTGEFLHPSHLLRVRRATVINKEKLWSFHFRLV